MTIANSFAAKLSVAFVAVAMALSMVAPAQAQTAEELQAQIDTLMATIASLQGTPAVTASGSAYVFTRPLTIGSEGADVTALQTYLIAGGYSIPAGATGYFGAQTAAAVAAWQTANGVMPAAGYFGPVSQAKYNALMAAVVVTPDEDEDEDEDEDTDSSDLQGEASLNTSDIDLQDGDDTEIEEGQEAAPVAEFELSFEDGDAMIDRLDVEFSATGEEDAWDTFEEVSLWVDGDEIGSIDASDEDNWNSDEKTLRFSGLDLVAMEDEDVTITIAVTVAGSVDDLDANWDVDVTEIRFTDADDVTSTEDITVTAVDFDITVEGADDEVIVKSSTEDIDATTLQLEDDGKSDMMTIFAFDIDTDDSTNDVEVDTIVVDVASTEDGSVATSTSFLINDAQLVVDGEEYDDVTITVNGSKFTFDIDGDLVIEAGDRITVEFQAEFKALGANFEGATVQASVDGSDIASEGADDITGEGSATGDEHTLRTEGAILEVTEVDETSKANDDGAADDEGVFTIEFEVTAFENDIWVNKTADRGTTMGTLGANYTIEDANGATVASAGTSTESLTSTADTDGSRFLVSEGETETFTLTVEYDPATEGFYQLQLHSFNFATTNANPTTQQLALPAEDYETGSLSI